MPLASSVVSGTDERPNSGLRRRVTGPRDGVVRPPSTAFRIGWLTVLVVTVGLHAYTMASWSWYQDDLLFTSGTPDQGALEFMFRPIADHWAPGTLGLIWLVTTLDPMSYTWPIVTTCLLAGGSILGWGLALREVFGERLHLVAGLVVLGVSPALLMDSLFGCRGLGTYSTLIAMGFCLWFLSRLLVRGPSVPDMAGLTLVYALGLFMWEKGLVVCIPLFFLCLLLGPADVRGAVRHCVRHLWTVAVLTAIFIPLFLWSVRDATEVEPGDPIPRTVGAALSFVGHGMVDVALPWMVGGPFTLPDVAEGFFPEASGPLALGLFAATFVLVSLGVVYRRRGWLAITMVVTYAAIAWGLVFFSNRFLFVGEIVVRSPHYSADLVPVMVLAASFLVTRTVLDDDVPLRRPVPTHQLAWVRRGLTAYLALVCVAATITTGRVWDRLEPTSPKPYLDTMLAEARDIGRADVYDTRVPVAIVNPVFLEDGSTVSAVVRPLDLPLRFNAPTERFAIVNDDGHFRETAIVGGHANDGPGPDGDCGYAVDTGEVTRVPMTGEFFSFGWVLEMTYFTGSDARISVRTDDDQVDVDLPAPEPGTVGKRQIPLSGEITSLVLEGLEGEATACVTEVRIGLIQPSDEVPDQLKD
jgi:hypothetical protein